MTESIRAASEEARRFGTAGDWLLRLQQDALTESELSEWIAWCESDPKNLAAFDELQALWHAAAEHPSARKADGVLRRQVLGARVPLWLAAAASVAFVLIASVFVLGRGPQRVETLAAVDSVQTPVATNQHALLPDGSHVEIGARTVVDVDFSETRRRLELRSGEAFFIVKHDTARPFVVEAGELEIVAVGTAFDVRRTGTETSVTVQEGVVEVRGESLPAVQGRAGEQLLFREGQVRRSLVDPAMALAWRAGRLEFTGDSLVSVVANVNRYSPRPIVLADPALGDLSFTGTVFVSSIDAWLDGLQQVFPVVVDRDAEQEIRIAPREGAP